MYRDEQDGSRSPSPPAAERARRSRSSTRPDGASWRPSPPSHTDPSRRSLHHSLSITPSRVPRRSWNVGSVPLRRNMIFVVERSTYAFIDADTPTPRPNVPIVVQVFPSSVEYSSRTFDPSPTKAHRSLRTYSAPSPYSFVMICHGITVPLSVAVL